MGDHTRGLPIVIALVATAALSMEPAAQDQPPRPDFAADLRARHPEIAENADFKGWADGSRVGPWYETASDGANRRTVVVQNDRGDRVFAALIGLAERSVQRTARIDLTPRQQTRNEAITAAKAGNLPTDRLRGSRPVVRFLPDGKYDFNWELDFLIDSKIETYSVVDKNVQRKSSRELFPEPLGTKAGATSTGRGGAPPKPMDPGTDDLASNELHHVQQFAQEAHAWTKGLTTVGEKVQRITTEVFNRYRYDATLPNIDVFTWSDQLTVSQHGRSGVCDELAVVAVSHLRALGIRSRLKLLIWTSAAGQPAAHAALEYLDAGTWKHSDPTWNKFNDPSVYRTQQGATALTVMDADFPQDARSTVDAWGVPDPTGDGRLHPYHDFLLHPAIPGNQRPGYSH